MPTINQLVKKSRKSAVKKTKSPAMTMTFNTLQ
ncbi:MAG: 30S ribosomal protein S12, partial [Candidatus Moranbacteria bacterium GW2011_GWE1_37_24]